MKKLITTLALIATGLVVGVIAGRVSAKHRKETAFQIAIANGFTGTIEDWVESFRN